MVSCGTGPGAESTPSTRRTPAMNQPGLATVIFPCTYINPRKCTTPTPPPLPVPVVSPIPRWVAVEQQLPDPEQGYVNPGGYSWPAAGGTRIRKRRPLQMGFPRLTLPVTTIAPLWGVVPFFKSMPILVNVALP